MKNSFYLLPGLLLLWDACSPALAQPQAQPMVKTGGGSTQPSAAHDATGKQLVANTITTVTYRGQSFLCKRTPPDLLTGDATDYLEKLESQLTICSVVLLADTINPTCPPEREATIRSIIKHLNLSRLNWNSKVYNQEFKFYLAEDKRRRHANDY